MIKLRLLTMTCFWMASACFCATASAAAKTVNFAYNTPTLSGTLPVVVGQEFGFFATEGRK